MTTDLGNATRAYRRPLTFRDLAAGASFEFDHGGDPLFAGLACGPWTKVSARKYTGPRGDQTYLVGSVAVTVVRVTA